MSKLNGDESRGVENASTPAFEVEDNPVDVSDISLVDVPGILIFWTLASIVFLQFFTRYVLNDSLAWTEEIARYVLIWVAFAGAISVSRRGTHIFLEFFYRYIPSYWAKVLVIFKECLSAVFWGYMAYVGIELAQRTRTKMASAEIPKSILYWGVTLFLAIMALYSLVWLLRQIRRKPDDILVDIEDHANNY